MLGIFSANAVRAKIGGTGHNERVCDDMHGRAIPVLPRALILGLIQEILMMTEVVVQQPEVGAGARMQGQQKLVATIEPQAAKGVHVLVVVAPGANHAFRKRKKQPVAREQPCIFDGKVDQHVQSGKQRDNGDRPAVCGVSKRSQVNGRFGRGERPVPGIG